MKKSIILAIAILFLGHHIVIANTNCHFERFAKANDMVLNTCPPLSDQARYQNNTCIFPRDDGLNTYFIEFLRSGPTGGPMDHKYRWWMGVGKEGKRRAISDANMMKNNGHPKIHVLEVDPDGIVLRVFKVK